MGIKYSKIALCLALCSSVYAQSFSVTSQSLEEAIQSIATQAKMPYMADGKLLKGKKVPTFSNVETLKEALRKVLEGSGLEAVIENETIMIQPKVQVASTHMNDTDAVVLKPISISSTPQSTVATTVIDSTYIQSAPTANHTITDLFRGKSYVQFDQSSLSSATGGEITPPKVSIFGSKHYENNFMLNGVSNNNDLNPAGSELGSSDMSGQPSGEAQSLFIDTTLVESVTMHTENVSSEYGDFLGGVVDAKLKDASKDEWHGSLSARYTEDSWARFHLTEDEREEAETTTTAKLQPEFKKKDYSLSLHGPISEHLGLMVSYAKKESEIPLVTNYVVPDGNGGWTRDKLNQYRESENFLVKLNTVDYDNFRANLTAIYAPYTQSKFIPNFKDSDYDIKGGGYTLIYEMENDLSFGKWKNTLSYQMNEISRDSSSNINYGWRNSYAGANLDWKNSTTSTTSSEGGFDDYEQKKQTYAWKSVLDVVPFKTSALEHAIKVGYEAKYAIVSAEREGYTSYAVANAKADTSVVGDKEDGILTGSQYFTRKVTGMAQEREVDYASYAAFLEDSIKIERFTIRPGIRVSTETVTKNIDPAWRMFVNADVFHNNVLNIYGGSNRYYGGQILSYATHMPIKTYSSTRTSATAAWVDGAVSNAVPYGLGDLKTPYSDEYNVGTSLNVYDTLFSVDYVNRSYKDQIRSKTISTGPTYREYTNEGESSYWGVTFAVSKEYDLGSLGKHASKFSATRSFSKSNSFDPLSAFTDNEETSRSNTHITYNGRLTPVEDAPATDFNRPWVIAYTHVAEPYDWLNLTGVLRYQTASKGMLTDGSGLVDPQGVLTNAYVDVDYKATFNVDLSTAITKKINGQKFIFGVDILNLFNRKNDATTGYASSSTSTVTYTMGRQFYANVRYEF